MNTTPTGWSKKDKKLFMAIKCTDFVHALALLNSIADIAEGMQHHPDIGIRGYNEVFVSTTTHSAGNVTDKDYKLANEINDLLNYQTRKLEIEEHGRK